MQRLITLFVLIALPGVVAGSAAAADTAPGYVMRYADVGGGQIVFTYEDDLWLVSGRWRRGPPHHHPSGRRAVRQVLARRHAPGVHRQLRRRRRRLRHGRRRRRARAADLPPRLRPGAGLVSRRPGHPVPLQPPGTHGRARALPRRRRRRHAGRAAPGPGGAADHGPRRQRRGLQPHRPRGPHLEALRGRHGPGHLGGHLRQRRDQEDHRLERHRPVPHVDGLDHLLQQRPRGRHPEPLRLRHGHRSSAAPDHVHGLRRQVPLGRRRADRVPARRRAVPAGHGQRRRHGAAHRDPLGPAPRAQRTGHARAPRRLLRPVARRRAGPGRGPRRDPQPARGRGRPAEPDPRPGQPREERRLEPPGRPGRVLLRPHGRGAALPGGPARQRRMDPADRRLLRLHPAAGLVARRQEHPLRRQVHEAAPGGRGRAQGDDHRPGRLRRCLGALGHPGLRVVAGQPLGGLQREHRQHERGHPALRHAERQDRSPSPTT